jgi:DNA-binding response OmpR family regulator
MHNKSISERCESAAVALGNPSEAEHVLRNLRILVVEDEFILGLDLQDFLESCGAEVIGPAASLEKAMELADGDSISCAILDVFIRGKTVFPVAGLLRDKRVPFLFHTGHGEALTLQQDWPDCEVLVKPIRYKCLIALLLKIADRNSAADPVQ